MAKRKLIFIGGGDFLRELLWTAQSIPTEMRDWEPAAILDDNVDAARHRARHRKVALPVVGTIADHQPASDEVFIPAIGHTRAKLRAAKLLQSRGAEFINLIHPSATIAPDAQLGNGIFIFIHSVISAGAFVEDFVTINAFVLIGHDAKVGCGCNLCPTAMVTGNASLGRGVLVGTHASIAPYGEVGDFATIGLGSAVVGKIPPGSTAMGVPARVISPSPEDVAALASDR